MISRSSDLGEGPDRQPGRSTPVSSVCPRVPAGLPHTGVVLL